LFECVDFEFTLLALLDLLDLRVRLLSLLFGRRVLEIFLILVGSVVTTSGG